MTTRSYASVTRAIERRQWSPVGSTFDGEFVVRAYSIISTDVVVINVWEPFAGHSTSFRDDEYGKLGSLRSRPLPENIDSLPVGFERTALCKSLWAEQNKESRDIILAAFTELEGARRSCKLLFDGSGEALIDLDDFNREVTA